MKYLKNPETNQIVKSENFGLFFDDWEELTETEIDAYKLQEAKALKLAQLKKNRDDAISSSTPKPGSTQVYEINGVNRTFQLRVSDIATVSSRIIRLQNAPQGTTAQWTDIEGERLNLTLEQFKSLANHLDVRDQAIYELYNEKKIEINSISVDEEYFDENQEPITALEALENININFS